MKDFPRFWFEGNLYFGWVNNLDELNVVFEYYKEGHMTKDEVLDKAVSLEDEDKSGKHTEFGLRIEHRGSMTLRQFLEEKGVDYGKE
ncbi:MAG: hypothetical protein WC333_01815 [Dehalococcoidia bacterium]|jgi:hypothetical protein